MKLLLVAFGLLSAISSVAHGSEESDTAIAPRSYKYYAQMWYRVWTFPVTMLIKAKVIGGILFMLLFTTIMQVIAYQRSEPQLPEIYTVPSHYGWA
ncbi:uncharacterized protein LOC131216000 [Anopheles bellator]|uniref:uncharacterized protein LOC131216000 n=1 Tax=Anopheles bellator TaxID=139047 RepID=UPI002648D88E|nr:uncharacterized protein LOC131216000 [Anopheles bellator]